LSNVYRVIGRIGAGGMGEVYEAEHVRLGRSVAVKLMRADLVGNREAFERFAREARLLAGLTNDHLVSVTDDGTTPDSIPFFVMERLRGADLGAVLRQPGGMEAARAVRLIVDACRGVAALHAAGIVHRDLKPANLYVVRRDDGSESCKVLDLGIARLARADSTQHGRLIGTLAYMAPEQLKQNATVDARTDVYALGAILYQCLAGRPPHLDDAMERVLFAIMHETPPSLSALGVPICEGLAHAVERALARDPDARFETAAALLAGLEPFSARAVGGAALPNGNQGATTLEYELTSLPRSRRVPKLTTPAIAGTLVAAALGFAAGRISPPLDPVPPLLPPALAAGSEPAPVRSVESRANVNPSELGLSGPALVPTAQPPGPTAAGKPASPRAPRPRPPAAAPSPAAPSAREALPFANFETTSPYGPPSAASER
jgi:serine/threonine protein kinase